MNDIPKTTLADGSAVYPEHRELKPNGQQRDYVVLSAVERAKGFVQPSPRHAAFRTELLALLDKHAGKLDASEMLALASHAVGQLIAFQDQRKMTPDLAMAVVSRNIEQGNREAMNAVSVTKGSS